MRCTPGPSARSSPSRTARPCTPIRASRRCRSSGCSRTPTPRSVARWSIRSEASLEQRPGIGRLPEGWPLRRAGRGRSRRAAALAAAARPPRHHAARRRRRHREPGLRDPERRLGAHLAGDPRARVSRSGTRAQMFVLDPSHPNALAPGKRPRTTLSPSLALLPDGRRMAFGTPGGDQQDQWALHFFLALVDFGVADLQEAIDAPTLHSAHMPSSFHPHLAQPGALAVEERVDDGRRRRARAARAPHPAQRPLGPRPRARRHARAAVASRPRPRRASRSPTRRRCRSRDSACRGGRVRSHEGRRGSGNAAGEAIAATAVERRFERVLDHLHAMLLEFDGDGRITYVSPHGHRDPRLPPEEIRELRRFEWIHAEDVAQILELSRKLASTGESAEAIYRARHKQGRWLWLEMSASSYSSPADGGDPHARLRARRDGGAPGGPRAAHHRGPLPRDGGERGGPDQRDRRRRQVRLREPELRVAAGHAGGGVHRRARSTTRSSRSACTPTIAASINQVVRRRASRAAPRRRSSTATATRDGSWRWFETRGPRLPHAGRRAAGAAHLARRDRARARPRRSCARAKSATACSPRRRTIW